MKDPRGKGIAVGASVAYLQNGSAYSKSYIRVGTVVSIDPPNTDLVPFVHIRSDKGAIVARESKDIYVLM
jgi:hypothetical protein